MGGQLCLENSNLCFLILFPTENCFVFSKEKLAIGFGIKDLIIVDAGDVLLVMDKNKDQELKYLVNQIKDEKKYDEYL